MTRDELREKVARKLALDTEGTDEWWTLYMRRADAAIALCMEEAAKVAEQFGEDAGLSAQYDQRDSDAEFTCTQAAAAIRALGKEGK